MLTMTAITLTTDLGSKDYYVAALKGTLLKLDPVLHVVDISHHISPFDIAEAAYQVRAAYPNFPEGTVHVIGIDEEPVINGASNQLPAIMLLDGQYFVGSDNGFFSLLLLDKTPQGFWLIDNVLSNPNGMKYPTKNIFLPIAVQLAKGETPDNLGTASESWNRAVAGAPSIDELVMRGVIQYFDHYGNAITNISKADFDRYDNVPFTIYFKNKTYHIEKISTTYGDVYHGERLAFFNDAGYLEIAINKGVKGAGGGANSLFALSVGDIVRVEFTPRGSATSLENLFDLDA